MTCINKSSSTSNTLKEFLLYKSLHYSYIQTKYNDKEEIMNNTFIVYVEPLLDDINNPALIQERKVNIDAALYENKIDANVYKPSSKKEIDHHDSDSYWLTSIKDTIQRFTFLTIIEHTANTLKTNKGLINSLLMVFSIFQLRLFDDKHK